MSGREALAAGDMVKLKKELVEKDTTGPIEFIETSRTLNDGYGLEAIKSWLRQDIELWKRNDVAALPKGYRLCGPVGTGKTFLAECLAGEASVPIVKMKNFRDKSAGSSEGNREKIFRLIHALGPLLRVYRRSRSGAWVARRGGRRPRCRWTNLVHAGEGDGQQRQPRQSNLGAGSSRPDLIEADLKHPEISYHRFFDERHPSSKEQCPSQLKVSVIRNGDRGRVI